MKVSIAERIGRKPVLYEVVDKVIVREGEIITIHGKLKKIEFSSTSKKGEA